MKKEYRIRKNEEFSEIIGERKRFSNFSFLVYYRKKKLEHARVGISVSKKRGNAVVRNKIKRQLRMQVRECIDLDEYPLDLVIVVKDGYLHKSYADNKKDLEKSLKTVRIGKYS